MDAYTRILEGTLRLCRDLPATLGQRHVRWAVDCLLREGAADASVLPSLAGGSGDNVSFLLITQIIGGAPPEVALAYRDHCVALALLHHARAQSTRLQQAKGSPLYSLSSRGLGLRTDIGTATLRLDRAADGREYLHGTDDACRSTRIADAWLLLAQLPRTCEELKIDADVEAALREIREQAVTLPGEVAATTSGARPHFASDIFAGRVALVLIERTDSGISWVAAGPDSATELTLVAHGVHVAASRILLRGADVVEAAAAAQIMSLLVTMGIETGYHERLLSTLIVASQARVTDAGVERELRDLSWEIEALELRRIAAIRDAKTIEDIVHMSDQLRSAEIADRLLGLMDRFRDEPALRTQLFRKFE